MKWLMATLIFVVATLSFYWLFSGKSKDVSFRLALNDVSSKRARTTNTKELDRLKIHSSKLIDFIQKNNYYSRYCFLIDMQLPSGSNRFFVYDLRKDSILDAGLVAHGSGSDGDGKMQFSNVLESNCTSLGRYKIGNAYHGRFGLAYKLHGLDSSNSNAFKRFVVLHSHSCVPEMEVAPFEICRSLGCPTVSPSFLDKLQGYIDKAEKPVLLEIFY